MQGSAPASLDTSHSDNIHPTLPGPDCGLAHHSSPQGKWCLGPSYLDLSGRTEGWSFACTYRIKDGYKHFSFPKANLGCLFLPTRLIPPTCVVFRVTQDGTASREDPKEKPETLGPWYDAPCSSTPCAEGQETKPTRGSPWPGGHGSGLSDCRPKRLGAEGPRSPCVSL